MKPDCASQSCQLLPWDSQFFGCRIARLHADRLTAHTRDGVLAWCHDHLIDCLYFLADGHHRPTQQLAVAAGFQHVGVRLTLQREAAEREDAAIPQGIRPCRAADVPALAKMARRVYTNTRFYADARFDRARCARLYETWLVKSCRGLADAVFVAESNAGPAGYITCRRLSREAGEIGLLGVRPEAQGQGLGRQLLAAALVWGMRSGLKSMRVVTQGDNEAAVRMYRRAGFETTGVHAWYHYWCCSAVTGSSPRQTDTDRVLVSQPAG